MPTGTIELFRVIELAPNNDIGLNDYPIFSEDYREVLNKKIIDRYHSREIGHETIGRFVFAMKRKMNEIMPIYNKLYESERLTFDPLVTMDLRTVAAGDTTTEAEAKSEGGNTSETSSQSRAVSSSTPQVPLSGRGDYATGMQDSSGTSNGSGTVTDSSDSKSNEQSNTESHTIGYQGSGASLVMEYRRSLLNIDLMIIEELEELFYQLWDNGDNLMLGYPYTPLGL